jgi:hypothetical protein|tara:strand:+ start:3236 stop:3670 length:435 start_codon:yes stop_codon:yes gene_type:complete
MSKKKSSKKPVKKMNVSKGVEKKHLEEFDVTDGKDRSEKQKRIDEVKELEDLLGMPRMNPYGTLHRDVFRQRVDASSVSELTDLAARVGVPRERNVNLLKKSLMKSFDFFVQKHNVTVQGTAKPVIDPSSPDYESTVKLFKEGF